MVFIDVFIERRGTGRSNPLDCDFYDCDFYGDPADPRRVAAGPFPLDLAGGLRGQFAK
jgi:hypothetical protein